MRDWETPESCLSPYKSSTLQITWLLRPHYVNVATKEKTIDHQFLHTFVYIHWPKRKVPVKVGQREKNLLAFKCGKVLWSPFLANI